MSTDLERRGADNRTYAECIAKAEKLTDAENSIGESYDKHLLTLASGALGLSILFIEKVATDPAWKVLLVLSWASFAICILSTLLAILFAQESINRFALINRELYDKGPEETDTSNIYADRVGILNWTALWAFVLGVVLFVVFAVINQKGSWMAKDPTPQPPRERPPLTESPVGHPVIVPKPAPPPPSPPKK